MGTTISMKQQSFHTTSGLELPGNVTCFLFLFYCERVIVFICNVYTLVLKLNEKHDVLTLYIRDPELAKRIGTATALEVRATGIPYAFAPCVAVSTLLTIKSFC